MYTVIKNKVYDTDKAQEIATYKYDGVTETLYRKKTGEYFMHFFNANADDNEKAGWNGKDKITPYDFETARTWAELSLDKESYDNLFGISAAEGTEVITIRIKSKTLAKIRKMQSKTGESIGKIIENAIAAI